MQPTHLIRGFAVVAAASLFALSACDHPTAPGTPGVSIITAPSADTIESPQSIPLTLEIRDQAGLVMRSTVVQFYSGSAPNLTFGYANEVQVGWLKYPGIYSSQVVDTTDAAGRVSVPLRYGPVAKRGRLYYVVGDFQAPTYKDSLYFDIRPGAPVATRMAPKDSTVYVDHTLQLHASVVDRRGNPRSEPVTYSAGPTLSVTNAGIVTPTTYARSWVVAHSAFGDDSGYVSVVPHGRVIAAMEFEGGGPFVQFDLDGSNYRTVPTLVAPFDAGPVWARDGKHFLYHNYDYSLGGLELWVADTTGQAARLFPRGTFHSVGWARFSADGQWLYFSVLATDNLSWSIWRSHPDGTSPVQLTTGTPWAQRPDPSPDNSRVAFRTATGIRTTDLSTSQPSSWIVPGLEPRWSPTGERIAVMPDGNGPLMLVGADGSNPHAITAANTMFGWQLYDQNFDWSPDGKWLVVSYNYMIQLLQVDTGLLLPLAWSQFAGQPAWEP